MTFLKWFIKLMKNELLNSDEKKNPIQWIIDESKCFSEEEVKKLKIISNKSKKQGLKQKRFTLIRNWFMVELGLSVGLRVAEMASLKCEDLLIDNKRSSIVVTGKGNKKRAVWISSDFKKNCQTYLKCKRDFGYAIEEDDYLLNNLKGGRISKRALQKFFKEMVKRSGLPGHYHIHCLRHTYSTFLLEASKHNYRFVQKQLGHASIKTTQVYAGVIEIDGRKAIEKMYR